MMGWFLLSRLLYTLGLSSKEIGDETAESLYSCCAIIIFSLNIVNFIIAPLIQYLNSNG